MGTTSFGENSELVERLKAGDERAYAQLVDLYHHRLSVYAKNLFKDHDGAQDIVQNAFIKVWEKRESLKAEYSLKSFLYKLVYNEFIDQYRKHQSIQILERKYIETLNQIVEEKDQEILEKSIAAVRKGIEELPPKCKEIFIMSKQEGLTNSEIAAHLNITIKTVEAQITKAYSLLRNQLGPKLELLLLMYFGKLRNEYHNPATRAKIKSHS